jgi:hypothetical protein
MNTRWWVGSAVFLGAVVLAMSGGAGVGDDCSSALPFLEGSVANNQLTGETLWYEFVATETRDVGFSVRFPGTDLVARIAVFDACGGTEIVTADGDFLRKGASVVFDAQAGTTYMIRISNISGAEAMTKFTQSPKTRACGDPGTGDCDTANGSPECEDMCTGISCPGCCDTVCALDAFCCDTEWDAICAGSAIAECVDIPVELQSFNVE